MKKRKMPDGGKISKKKSLAPAPYKQYSDTTVYGNNPHPIFQTADQVHHIDVSIHDKPWVDSVLNANADKNFVQRYQHPYDFPVIDNKTGQNAPYDPARWNYSSLLMADEGNRSYPTIVQGPAGQLKNLGNNDTAWEFADTNNEFINFKNPQDARWFSSNAYKLGTQYPKTTNPVKPKMPMGGTVPPPKNVNMNPSQEEIARVGRIAELAKQWKVPTQNIYSQVKYGPKDISGKAQRDYTSYWTFDPKGNIVNSTRDMYDNSVRGYSGSAMYTQKYTQPAVDNSIASNAAQITPTVVQRYGGKTPSYEYGGQMQAYDPNCGIQFLDGVKAMEMAKNGASLDMETISKYMNGMPLAKDGIHINPANKGKFTASASKAGMGVQEFASHVLANKGKYSATQVKRANFARNANKWHKAEFGTDIPGYAQPYEDPSMAMAKKKISDYFDDQQNYQQVPNAATMQGPRAQDYEYMFNNTTNTVDKSDYDPIAQPDDGTDDQGDAKKTGPSAGQRAIKAISQNMPNIHLNAGVAITALAGFATKGLKKAQEIDEFSRLKRRQLTGQTYNPNAYGTGSQAIMKMGGMVSKYQLTPEQTQFLKKQGYKI